MWQLAVSYQSEIIIKMAIDLALETPALHSKHTKKKSLSTHQPRFKNWRKVGWEDYWGTVWMGPECPAIYPGQGSPFPRWRSDGPVPGTRREDTAGRLQLRSPVAAFRDSQLCWSNALPSMFIYQQKNCVLTAKWSGHKAQKTRWGHDCEWEPRHKAQTFFQEGNKIIFCYS